jgi:Fe-Mn family superoxide dismutase
MQPCAAGAYSRRAASQLFFITQAKDTTMAHEPKNYDHLIGKMPGLSEKQLKAHFSLYQGYVKKLNEIEEKLGKVDKTANYSYSEYSELRRREPVAYNGTYLHELYFDNLGGAGSPVHAGFKAAATSAFGSYDNWIADLKACAGSAHGWVLTTWAQQEGRLRNNLVQSEHHVGLLVDQTVVCAVDVWEHAYFTDYGTAKADYVTAVIAGLEWNVIGKRFDKVSK